MTIETDVIRAMSFSRFAVERCIRVLVDGNGHVLRPIDSRQVESVLEPIAFDIGLGPANLILVETPIEGQTFAMVVERGSDLDVLATIDTDPMCQISQKDFGGVWWRVVGLEDGFPNEPFELAITDCENSANCTCMSLQALLEPARVAVGMERGVITFTTASRPVEMVFLEADEETVRTAHDFGDAVINVETEIGPKQFAHQLANIWVDAVEAEHIWSQLP